MQRTLIGDLKNKVGEAVVVKGWVSVRRDEGKMVFFDVRDVSGTVQAVALPKSGAIETAKETNREFVVAITGVANKRPEKNIDADKPNGDIELVIENIEILNTSLPLPFELMDDQTINVNEEIRLKYRYLDLRSPRMQRSIRMRDKIIAFFRDYMRKNGFIEIETPIMMKGTPEGSREYIVPSRLEQGKFYVLPRSR